MKPYYDDGRGMVIFHGCCKEILPTLPKADLCLTDPPYGLADKWTGGTWGAAEMYKDAKQWDRDIPTEFVNALWNIAPSVIIWGGNLYSLPPSRCWLAWEKTSKMDTMADFELAWTNFDRPSKRWLEDRNPDGQRQHPTQKPLSLMSWCLSFAPAAQTVIDPYMGSGTTLRACKDLGKRCIGIEREEKYAEIAAKRLSQEVFAL